MTRKEAFKMLADKMDARDKVVQTVKHAVENDIKIPEELLPAKEYINEKPWRQDHKVISRLKKTAILMAKNSKRKK